MLLGIFLRRIKRNEEKKGLFVSWKVDRVLANQRLNLTAGTEITSNVPKAWIIIEDLPPGRKGQWHS